MEIRDLETLRDAMINGASDVLDQHGQWDCDLPTFGGEAPDDTAEVWSWDRDRLLVGTCAHDLEIVDREAECVYCGCTQYGDLTVVPGIDDEDAWGAIADTHATDCEWVQTRAHRRDAR